MKSRTTQRGFRQIVHEKYTDPHKIVDVLQESSAVDLDREDGPCCPGSSYLWIGSNADLHFDRQEVSKLILHLQHWLDVGRLPEICPGCDEQIDTTVCYCGMPPENHRFEEHPFVPVGCDCYRAKGKEDGSERS